MATSTVTPRRMLDYPSYRATGAGGAGAASDTNSYYGWFDPAQQEGIDRDAARWQRNEYRGGVDRMDTATDQQDSAMQGATDPTRLRLDAGYGAWDVLPDGSGIKKQSGPKEGPQ